MLETGPPSLLSLIFDLVSSRNFHIELLFEQLLSQILHWCLISTPFRVEIFPPGTLLRVSSLLSLPLRTTGTGYDMTNIPKLDVCHALHRLLINNLKTKHTKNIFFFFFFFDRNKTKYNYTRVASRKRLILSLSPTSSKSIFIVIQGA